MGVESIPDSPRLRALITVAPGLISANSESDKTFTIDGLQAGLEAIVTMTSLEAGLGIVNVSVSAPNVIKIRFRNFTGGDITPAAQNLGVTQL